MGAIKKVIIPTFLGIVLFFSLILGLIYGTGWLQRGTADFRGETSKIEQTNASGSYRIAQYEHFYDSCASVQSIEGKIVNMQDELDVVEDEQRKIVLNASITASKNKRAELIAKYNADARKEGTMAQFKSSDLPFSLSDDEGVTICEVY